MNVDGKAYIIRILKVSDSYFATILSEDVFFDLLSDLENGSQSILFIADDQGEIIACSSDLPVSVDTENDGDYIRVDGRDYLQTGYESGISGYCFGVLTSKSYIMAPVTNFQIAFFFMFFILMFFMLYTVFASNRVLAQPIRKISDAMKRFGHGEWQVSLENNAFVEEFSEMTDTLHHMVREVEDLKIKNYEAELKYQKANLQYMQLQIKPHFYANALNIIYSLAQIKDYETIQKMTGALVAYSRYMFSDANTLVSLRKELGHVENYMVIQQLRYTDRIDYQVSVPEELMEVLVPPFVVQSFVENSVKYGFVRRERLEISVSARTDGDMLVLTVQDNGSGYPQAVLDAMEGLKHPDPALREGGGDSGRHIGLNNVYERIRLIFGEDAHLKLYNDNGSVSQVTLPMMPTDMI